MHPNDSLATSHGFSHAPASTEPRKTPTYAEWHANGRGVNGSRDYSEEDAAAIQRRFEAHQQALTNPAQLRSACESLPEPPTAKSLNGLRNEVTLLQERFKCLVSKLEPALTPEPAGGENRILVTQTQPRPLRSPVADAIETEAVRVAGIIDGVNSIIRRIEL